MPDLVGLPLQIFSTRGTSILTVGYIVAFAIGHNFTLLLQTQLNPII